MTQSDRRQFLLRELLKEQPEYAGIQIPKDIEKQKAFLRSLMNVRPPKPVSQKFLAIQDAYLQEELQLREITDGNMLPSIPLNPHIALWQGDITALKADAIVNAANSTLLGCFQPLHSCIDNCIHSQSGIQLRLFCDTIMKRQGRSEPTGKAKITPAFNLPSTYILHTVGPIVSGSVTEEHRRLLASCYRSCLELAEAYGLKSVAFCCISTGEFHFSNELAAKIAVQTVTAYMAQTKSRMKVIFNVFKDTDYEIYQHLLG